MYSIWLAHTAKWAERRPTHLIVTCDWRQRN